MQPPQATIRINQTMLVCVKFSCRLSIKVTTERPVQVKVVKVKKSDKGDFYKRQQTWELRDLTEVDAKDASKVCTSSQVTSGSRVLLHCESGAGGSSSSLLNVFFCCTIMAYFLFLV